ncbi:DUF2236 domain-containing protein [Rhodococcus triatomae]|uniref:Uncharacterized conserved protein, DUF2236 family n=1 Tax=Rhodococcus triatomae TaxID=300028 RepID=A0A1G8IF41_9NOCA|nr:oxygenase MpaB family protein [Rhodococcus triatomae]QNG21035.1 DUF2236 domain-containing protein [Rhodococcus triatomae]QNG23050.1 DUF2236 domain-containing protein [Rhodococcus triatomae]SDI17351.1 Uncharacterized conserved protein, DUF2236 family [Rhodococcus triatomae]
MKLDIDTLRRDDYGFFGPGSPSWKVWASPTALIGFQRAVVLEHFDPALAASVADMRGIYADPAGRLDRTLAYFLAVAVGDGRTAVGLSEHLMSVHAQSTGIEPVTGKRYSANNPESQLWIHVTGWHSVLKCYEMYGPGPLSADAEARFWRECVAAAELQTCRPSDVPTSRAEVRDYFAAVRPRLCTTERALEAMHYLLRTPRGAGPTYMALSRVTAPATIATLPGWMRQLGGFDQSALTDRAIVPVTRAIHRTLAARNGRLLVAGGGRVAPMTVRIFDRHNRAGEPASPHTVTPAGAMRRHGSRRARTATTTAAS